MIFNILWILNALFAVLLIVIVLLQTGKGSEVGFAIGSGAAQTMFGASGGKTVINRVTIILAVSFMATSIILAFMSVQRGTTTRSVMDKMPVAEQTAPASAGANTASQVKLPVAVKK